ncbi:hypothetical protein, partial [Gryllotalpicola koreensis]|uniref:hypothetical protein n=1 Tax=Gryllotalpicola koreensis TaxID=993086 RepID=UPI0031DF3BB9
SKLTFNQSNKPKESNTQPKTIRRRELALTMCTLLSSQRPYAPGLDLAAITPERLSKFATPAASRWS